MATNHPDEKRAAARTGPVRESTFTRNLRYEVASEEGRALLGSWGASAALGIIWLVLVAFGPRGEAPSLLAPPAPPIEVKFDENELPPPTPIAPQPGEAETTPAPGPKEKPPGPKGPETGDPKPGRPGSKTETNATGAIGDAFGTGSGSGTGGLVGDVGNVLRGVDVSSGSGGTGGGLAGTGGGGTGGKTVLGYGQGGQGSRTPGRGGIGGGTGTGGGGGGGIGGVGAGGGVVLARVAIRAPSVVTAPPLGGQRGNVDELGTFVRSRESQLRFCYNEYGLKNNPTLAGTITVAIAMRSSGDVTGVNISSRTWGGAGASEAESCIKDKIRSWHFPSSAAADGTFAFPFNFTRGG
jgi:hypothetical protein